MKHKDEPEALPTKVDFNPWGQDALDAEYAWKTFGGLTLNEARAVFLDRPDLRQEDFMFMGGKAFSYYFPIVEEYLREAPDNKCEGDDRESWILAQCIVNQFRQSTSRHMRHLAPRIIQLSRFVRDNLHRFGDYEEEKAKIAAAWVEVTFVAATAKEGH